MYTKQFLASEITAPEYAENCQAHKALFHVIPVPYEESVSYGDGTALGPAAILEASNQLELSDGLSVPAELGIYTHAPVNCDGPAEIVLEHIETATHAALHHGGIPVLLGGEHTVTYGALKALRDDRAAIASAHGPDFAHKSAPTFGVIQFDAHADLRDSYEGSKWSHACVMRRAVNVVGNELGNGLGNEEEGDADGLGLPLVQFGVRAMGLDEMAFRAASSVVHYDAAVLAGFGHHSALPEDLLPADFPEDIYITFDVDGLDPSIMPATGTPVPGGIGWYQALAILERVIKGRRVIGFDVVELAPIDASAGGHAWNFTAARLVYAIMGMVQRLSLR